MDATFGGTDKNGEFVMRVRSLLLASASVALVLTTTGTVPAYAAGEFTITVDPDSAHPAEHTTVTGDATDPTCADDGVAVTLTYTKPNGSTGAVTVNTTTDAEGHFTADLTVPDNAVAGGDAQVTAVIADCTPPAGETVSRSSEPVPFEVLAYEGTFTISKTTGKPGEKVTFSGTNCWGGDVVVFFGDDDSIDVTLNSDKTFSGTYTLPDAPGGTYEFGAACPGTDFESKAFVLVNPKKVPPTAPKPPAARGVRGRAHFTG